MLITITTDATEFGFSPYTRNDVTSITSVGTPEISPVFSFSDRPAGSDTPSSRCHTVTMLRYVGTSVVDAVPFTNVKRADL